MHVYILVAQNLDFLQTLLSMSPMFFGILATTLLIVRLWVHRRVQQMITIGFLVIASSMTAMAMIARLPYLDDGSAEEERNNQLAVQMKRVG